MSPSPKLLECKRWPTLSSARIYFRERLACCRKDAVDDNAINESSAPADVGADDSLISFSRVLRGENAISSRARAFLTAIWLNFHLKRVQSRVGNG